VGVPSAEVGAGNHKLRASLEEEGLQVAGIDGMGITENVAIGAVKPQEIAQFAVEKFNSAGVELLFISCTNFRALEARERI